MNGAIAERLRDLLERRFAGVVEAWSRFERAAQAAHEEASDSAFHDREECAHRYSYALIHYCHAFREERHLSEIWNLGGRLWEGIPTKQPSWWRDHRFEWGWKLASEIESMPSNVDHHRFEPIRRLHDWVLDQLAAGVATATTVERFARGVERFEQKSFREALLRPLALSDTSNSDERTACLRMAAWLHAQGLDPWNELQLGNGRADVTVPSGPGAVAIEAKVIRPGDDDHTIRDRLRAGIAQARAYADRLAHTTGYLVVFWLSDTVFLERREEVRFGDGTVRVLVVDLRSKTPSELGGARVLPLPLPEGLLP